MKFCVICGETLNHNGRTCADPNCRQADAARTGVRMAKRTRARGERDLELLDAQLRASYAATGGVQ